MPRVRPYYISTRTFRGGHDSTLIFAVWSVSVVLLGIAHPKVPTPTTAVKIAGLGIQPLLPSSYEPGTLPIHRGIGGMEACLAGCTETD